MDGAALIVDGLGRVQEVLHRALKDVPADVLCRLPTRDTNSMAWLAWHLTRVQDHHLSDLAALPQQWTSRGWHAKFGMQPDDTETGSGHTPQQVAALKVDAAALLLGYYDAVYERSKQYLATVQPSDLDGELNEPQYTPLPTVGVRLVSVLSDNAQHAGQIAYLRGYFEGRGWQRY